MASPRSKVFSFEREGSGASNRGYRVYIKGTDQFVAWLTGCAGSSNYTYRLASYPHRNSRVMSLGEALRKIEDEVL